MAKDENVTQGSDDAKAAAMEKMRKAIAAQKDVPEEAPASAEAIPPPPPPAPEDLDPNATFISQLKVYSPFNTYYDAPANSISAENLTGPFDILAGHKNFISLLVPGEVTIRSSRGEDKIKIDGGIMHVKANKVTVFLDV